MPVSLAMPHVSGRHWLRRAFLAVAFALVPVLAFAQAPGQVQGPGVRPLMPHEEIEQTLRERLGRTPSQALVRGVASQMQSLQGNAGGAGTLDPSFGTGGKQTIDFSLGEDAGQAIAVDTRGRVVVVGSSSTSAGHCGVVRLSSEGTLDQSFGIGGKQTVGHNLDFCNGVAIDASGRIVVAGSTGVGNGDFAVIRLSSDGMLDTSFGSGGKQFVDFGVNGMNTSDFARSVAIDASGRIVLAGWSNGDVYTYGLLGDFAVARLNSDGTLDHSFGTRGKKTIDFSASVDIGFAVAIDASGRIVVAGRSGNHDVYDFAVIRLNSDGVLDQSFGTRGKTIVDLGGRQDEARAVALDEGGRVVVAGYTYNYISGEGNSADGDFAVVRLSSDGTLDTGFGAGGKQTVDLGGNVETGRGVALDASGRIVVVGRVDTITGYDFGVVRLSSDGTLDPSFGTGGKQTVDFGGSDYGQAIAVDGSGNVLVAGYTNVGGGDFAVARLLGEPGTVASATVSGTVTDATGAPVRGARVLAFGTGGRAAVTDGSGRYTIRNLTPGNAYTLRVGGRGATPATTTVTPTEVGVVGQNFQLTVRAANGVYAWGVNDNGQTNVPAGLTDAIQVTATRGSTFALRSDGTTLAWPASYGTPPPVTSGILQVDAGEYSYAALKEDGTVVTWVMDAPPPGLTGVVKVTVGHYHAIALKDDGTVVGWGTTDRNQLDIPAGLTDVVDISTGDNHSVALRSDGTVVAWGWDQASQAAVPAGLSDVVQVAVGTYHSAALSADGTLHEWGREWAPNGQSGFSGIRASFVHTYAITPEGRLFDWGLYDNSGMPAGLANVADVTAGGSNQPGGGFTVAIGESAALPVVTTLAATVTSGSTATLNGTVNPGGELASYLFRYSTSADLSNGTTTPVASAGTGTAAVAVLAPVAGLAPSTLYYVRIEATSVGGTSLGSVLSFTTAGSFAPPVLAALPAVVSIEPTLDWSDMTGATGYTVELATDAAFATKRTVSTGTTSQLPVRFDALPLLNSTPYYWRVVATGAGGDMATTTAGTFTTTPPAVPTLYYPSANAASLYPLGIDLTWGVTAPGAFTFRLQVDEGTTATPADWTSMAIDQAATASPLRVDLSWGRGYQWRVATHNAALAASNPLAGTTVSYATPRALTTQPGASAGAQVVVLAYPTSTSTPLYTLTPALQWYVQGGAIAGTTYQVQYRAASGAYPASPQGTGLTSLSFATAALTPGTGYAWQARACVGATCGAWSGEQTFSIHSSVVAPGTPPAPPAALAPAGGVAVYGSTAKLTWAASASNLTYRAFTRVCATADCAAERATTSGYAETNTGSERRLVLPVASGQSVAWYVTACTATNVCSAPSPVAYFTVGATATTATRAVPSSPVASALVYTLTPELRWYLSGGTAGVGGYEVRYGATSDPATFIGSGATSGAGATGFTVASGLAWGQTYYWHVRVSGAPAWSTATFKTVSASGSASASPPVLDWPSRGEKAQVDTQLGWHLSGSSAGVTGYEVELTRLGSGGSTTTTAVMAPASSLALGGLVAGASYTWRVRTLSSGAASDWSSAGAFVVDAGPGTVMPLAVSPSEGVMLTGTAPPTLSWSLPVESASALRYEVELARTADMASAEVLSGLAAPSVALRSLGAGTWYWRVRSRTTSGEVSAFSDVETFGTQQATVTSADGAAAPAAFALEAVYPNPVARTAAVRFALPTASSVRVVVYDALGRERAVLLDEARDAGVHTVTVDASELPSGVYVLRVQAGTHLQSRTFVVQH